MWSLLGGEQVYGMGIPGSQQRKAVQSFSPDAERSGSVRIVLSNKGHGSRTCRCLKPYQKSFVPIGIACEKEIR